MQELHTPSPGLTSEQRRENATSVIEMFQELQLDRVVYGLIADAAGIPLSELRKTPLPLLNAESKLRFEVLMSDKFKIEFCPKQGRWPDIWNEVLSKCPTWREIVKDADFNEVPDAGVW